MSFLVKGKKFLKKYTEIWGEIKYLNTKVKFYNNKITTNFKNADNNSTKPHKEGIKSFCL